MDDEEAIDESGGNGRDDEEVHGGNGMPVIAEERAPDCRAAGEGGNEGL